MKRLILIILTGMISTLGVSAQTENEHGIMINRRPLQDLDAEIQKKVSEKKLDLRKPFSITINGKLTKEGKLDYKQTKVETAEGSDPEMAQIARSAVETLSEAGYFRYLTQLGAIGDIIFTLSQDADRVSARIATAMENEAKAKASANGLEMVVSLAEQKEGADELSVLLLKNARILSEGKTMHILFSAPAEFVAEALGKRIGEHAAPKQ